jgi:hypothetical protein
MIVQYTMLDFRTVRTKLQEHSRLHRDIHENILASVSVYGHLKLS